MGIVLNRACFTKFPFYSGLAKNLAVMVNCLLLILVLSFMLKIIQKLHSGRNGGDSW